MDVNKKEYEENEDAQSTQDSANKQSMLNIISLKKHFGPKMDALTESINKSSRSSTFLSWVLIGVTAAGTIIAALTWYSNNAAQRKIQALTNDQFQCVFETAKSKGDIAMLAAIELCTRSKEQ